MKLELPLDLLRLGLFAVAGIGSGVSASTMAKRASTSPNLFLDSMCFVADLDAVLAHVSSLLHVFLPVTVKASEKDLSVKRGSIRQSLGALA